MAWSPSIIMLSSVWSQTVTPSSSVGGLVAKTPSVALPLPVHQGSNEEQEADCEDGVADTADCVPLLVRKEKARYSSDEPDKRERDRMTL
jgi:hypothetical protein